MRLLGKEHLSNECGLKLNTSVNQSLFINPNLIATACDDATITLSSISNDKSFEMMEVCDILSFHDDAVTAIDFSYKRR